jgi:hypothetical protein
MAAGGRSTLVDLFLAMGSPKPFAAGACIPVDAVSTEHGIWATGTLITFIGLCFAPSAFVTGEAVAFEPGDLGKHDFQVKKSDTEVYRGYLSICLAVFGGGESVLRWVKVIFLACTWSEQIPF